MDRPILQSMLLAHVAHFDRQSREATIVGAFHRWRAPSYPTEVKHQGKGPTVFLSLTNIIGKRQLTLLFKRGVDDLVLREWRFPVETANPLDVHELIIDAPPLPLPAPGLYVLEVVSDDVPLGYYRLHAVPTEAAQ